MRATGPDGSPYFLSAEGGGNFGWYQGVAGVLGAHVLAQGGDGVAHIRRVITDDDVPTTASILEDVESIAPGTLALIDRLGVGYRDRDEPPVRPAETAGDAAWLPDQAPLVHFSAEDRVIRLENRNEIIAYCNRIVQGRCSTREELGEQTVHLLTPDAAYVVTRSRQTTQ